MIQQTDNQSVLESFRSPLTTEGVEHMARALGWPFIDLESYQVSCGILRKVPAEFACRLRFVPLLLSSRRAVLAVDDPFTGAYLEANSYLLGPPYRREVEPVLTTPRGLDCALDRRVSVVR